MGEIFRSLGDWRGLRAVMLLVALGARLLIPAGYMPSAGGGFPLVICTGHGPAELAAPQRGAPADPDAHHKADQVCAFAAMAMHAGPTTEPAPESQPIAYLSRADRAVPDLAPGRGLTAPPPPSQAPPRLL